MIGKCKMRNSARGFGFLAPEDGSIDVFVHVTALDGLSELAIGDRVEFTEEIDRRSGKTRAENVRLAV